MIPISVHKRPRPHFPLAELLHKKRMTQYQLAKISKLSCTYINRLFLGKQQPTWPTVCIIAAALGASLGDFNPASMPR